MPQAFSFRKTIVGPNQKNVPLLELMALEKKRLLGTSYIWEKACSLFFGLKQNGGDHKIVLTLPRICAQHFGRLGFQKPLFYCELFSEDLLLMFLKLYFSKIFGAWEKPLKINRKLNVSLFMLWKKGSCTSILIFFSKK